VETARKQVADLIGANAKEIIFTSGATEANNLAIKGAAEMYREKGNHIITCVTEHKAVIDTCKKLEKQGARVTYLPVQKDGRISLDELQAAITDKTILITIMAANNEIGVLQPIAEIGAIARPRGSCSTPTQCRRRARCRSTSRRTRSISCRSARTSCMARRAWARSTCGAATRACCWPSRSAAAGHERGMRSGTLNVPGIVGLGAAAALAKAEMATEAARLSAMRDRLNKKFHENLDEIYINGSMEHRLPHNLNISFAYVEGESLLMGINDVAVSSGSACTSASLEPSYVLKALGAGDDLAHSSIRFGLGRWTTDEEVDYVVEKLTSVVRRLREMSPLYEMVKEGVDLSKMQWVTH
jgi:cysteine desulfurase